MEPENRKDKQREVMYFAQDLFNFLSTKRFPTNEIPKSGVKSNYHEVIGNACAYLLQFSRSIFLEILNRDYPNQLMGSRYFVAWFGELLVRNYSREPNDPFSGAIESLALMFEVAIYAYERGHTNLYPLLPTLWTEYFMENFYPDFFDKGGWTTFKGRAKDVAGTYKRFFLSCDPGAMELIAGLREDAPTSPAEGATGGYDPEKQIKVPCMLQRAGYPAIVDMSSSLAQTLKGIWDIKLDAALQPVMQEAYEKYYTPEATSAEDLPGCRKRDPIRIRLGGSPSDFCCSSPEKAVPGSSKGDESPAAKSPDNKADRGSGQISDPCSRTEEGSDKNESAGGARRKKPKKRSSGKRQK